MGYKGVVTLIVGNSLEMQFYTSLGCEFESEHVS